MKQHGLRAYPEAVLALCRLEDARFLQGSPLMLSCWRIQDHSSSR